MALNGRRILITRTRRQASELAAQLDAEGATTILIPTIEIAPPSSFAELDAALGSMQSFQWVIFTSANAVHAFAQRSKDLGVAPHPEKIAAIGPATAQALEEVGLSVDLVPPQFVAESLVEALLPFAPGASTLLVRAEEAREVLPQSLVAAGARLTIAPAYRKVVPAASVEVLQKAFQNACPDAVTFTSSSTAENFFALMDRAGLQPPPGMALASIGPVTSRTLQELGHPTTIEAAEATVSGLCQALMTYFV